MKGLLIVISILFQISPVYANGLGTKGGIILSYPVGAQAIGMGEAFVGVAQGVNAIYWNPAGLVSLESKEFTGYYLDGLVDANYKFMGYAQPMRFGVIGCGISNLDGGKATIYNTDGTTKNVTAQTDYIFMISYANKVRENLSFGGNIKLIQSELGETSKADAFACDLGGLYNIPAKNLKIGVAIQNMGTEIKYEEEGDPLPLNIKLGTAYRFNNLLLALDINKPIENKLRFNIGGEYWIAKIMALRAGYKFKQEGSGSDTGLTAGIGFKISNYRFDYAYVPYGNLDNTHQVSLTARF
ncbi:PorV/PorQ family protein [bacterium]|nr:PorV/PorQ family protein [bacterium]MBU1598702.1 PorV/PorQ family protein [bacterium]MBU2461289.1 PorV/PorQ family protein [bacterium]